MEAPDFSQGSSAFKRCEAIPHEKMALAMVAFSAFFCFTRRSTRESESAVYFFFDFSDFLSLPEDDEEDSFDAESLLPESFEPESLEPDSFLSAAGDLSSLSFTFS